MSKSMILMLAITFAVASAEAQEMVSRADAVKFAALLNFDLETLADTPLPTDADIKRPYGMKAEKRGALVVPEAKLSAATLANAGKEAVPVGQLWLAGLVPMKDGQAVAKERLRLRTVEYEGREVTLPLLVLGVRKGAGDRLELLVYGKDKEPLLAAPLAKSSSARKWPIEFDAEREGDSGRLTFYLVGKYEASFSVTAPGE